MERLQHYMLPHIIARVRSVQIVGNRSMQGTTSPLGKSCDSALKEIIAAIWNSMPLFNNITHVFCADIDLTEAQLDWLSSLCQPLTEFRAHGCGVGADCSIPRISARDAVILTGDEFNATQGASFIAIFTGVLQSQQLRRLTIGAEDLANVLQPLRTYSKSGAMIKTLQVIERASRWHNQTFLLRDILPICKSLEGLSMIGDYIDWIQLRQNPPNAASAPNLKRLSCSMAGVECFSRLTSINELELEETLQYRPVPLSQHLLQLRPFYCKLKKLTLRILAEVWKVEICNALAKTCEQLQTLDLDIIERRGSDGLDLEVS